MQCLLLITVLILIYIIIKLSKNSFKDREVIPKKIHQTWYKKDIPGPIQKSINNMLDLHPYFEYYFYDDDDIEEYIRNRGTTDMLTAYKKLTVGASKADFFRYIVLYYDGGIYVDIDSSLVKNIEPLISNKSAVISREYFKNSFMQAILMFSPRHPILKNAINLCIDNIYKNRYPDDIWAITGPGVYRQAIQETTGINNEKMYNMKDKDINEFFRKMDDVYLNNTIIMGLSYNEYAIMNIPEKDLLYKERPHWSKFETKITPR